MFDNISFDTGWQLVNDRHHHHRRLADWRSTLPASARDVTRLRRGRGLTSAE